MTVHGERSDITQPPAQVCKENGLLGLGSFGGFSDCSAKKHLPCLFALVLKHARLGLSQ